MLSVDLLSASPGRTSGQVRRVCSCQRSETHRGRDQAHARGRRWDRQIGPAIYRRRCVQLLFRSSWVLSETFPHLILERYSGFSLSLSLDSRADFNASNIRFIAEIKPVPFACSKCKAVNKVVKYWYVSRTFEFVLSSNWRLAIDSSADCQRQAWPTHKKVCGVPLANVASVASFS